MTVYDGTPPLQFAAEMGLAVASLIGCSPEQGKAMALQALCEGISPMQLQRRYHWIQGKPSMKADAMRAEFRMNHGGDFEILETSGDVASIKFIDQKGRELISTITWEQAQLEPWPWQRDCGPGTERTEPIAKNLKDNWATPISRSNMLMARATSVALRRLCPELVAGVYTPEEMQDIESAPRVEPAEKRPTAAQIVAAAAEGPMIAVATVAAVDQADGNVEEAEFEIKTIDATPGGCTDGDCLEITQLGQKYFGEEWPAKCEAALKKRNCQILKNLSPAQAKEMIATLTNLIREREATEKN